MKKALTLAFITTALALLLLPAASLAAITPTKAERTVIKLVNKERAKQGLAAVRFNAALTRAARAHAREMARRQVLTHRSANGATIAGRAVANGYKRSRYRYWTVGENVASARSGTPFATPAGAVCLWSRASTHRQIMLRGVYRNIGVGVATAANGTRYFTIDLGRRTR